MKYIKLYLLLLISVVINTSCGRKIHEHVTSANQENIGMLSDSINILDSLVNAIKISNNRMAHYYANRAIGLAIALNSQEALARALLLTGVAYKNFSDDSSFIYYSRAYNIANKYNLEKIKPKIYYNLAMIYYSASDSKKSMLYLDSSINVAQKVKDWVWMSNSYNALGNLKSDLLDSSDARSFFDSSFRIAERHSLQKQLGIAMASLSRFEKDQDEAGRMQKQAIATLQKHPGNEEETALILINLGTQNSNADSSIKYYQTAIKLAKLANSTGVEIASYNNLAYSFMDKSDLVSADKCLILNAIPLALKNENQDWLSTLYDSYSEVLFAEHKTGQALIYERKALNSRMKADKKQAAGQVRLLASLLNVKNRELVIQEKERELQQKENKIHLMNFWFSVAFIVLLLIVFLIVWKLQRNKIRFHKELLESAKRLITFEETIKGRVSMELHDLIGPFHAAMLEYFEEAQINNKSIEQGLKNKLITMTTSLRQISHRMQYRLVEQFTISELVRDWCKALNKTSSIPINYYISKEDFSLSKEETLHIYRIVQELLTNGIKYVTFGEINLSLSEERSRLFILYKDTGPGFDTQKIKQGLGIQNIFERAKIIHGTAVLNSSPGKGTRWNITIPITHTGKVSSSKTNT